MKEIVIALAVASAASLASAKDISVEVDGKTVTVKATALNRQITGTDRDGGTQGTALGCSFLYYARLAKADIKAAAALSTDPKATEDKLTQYRDRIGADDFKKTMAAYFTAKNVVLAELAMGDAVMLVVKTDEYTAGQIYVKRGDKWLWEENPRTEAGKAFGKVLNMIRDDKIKL